MKKNWTILGAAALLVLSLASCAGNKTQGNLDDLTADPSPSTMPNQDIHGTADSGDLAGRDGMVDGDGVHSDVDKPGRADNSPVEKAGDAIRDTVDDAGNGVRNALDDLGDAARDVGRDARDMIENR